MKFFFEFKNFIFLTLFLLNFFIILTPVLSKSNDEIIDRTVSIEMNHAQSFYWNCYTSSTYYVHLEVLEGNEVDFFLMDSTNYDIYWNYFTTLQGTSTWNYYSIGSQLNAISIDYSFSPTVSGTYYVVIENAVFTNGGASSTGSVRVKAQIYKDEVIPTDNNSDILLPLVAIGVMFILGLTVIFVFVIKNQKPKIPPRVYYDPNNRIMNNEVVSIPAFCPQCGNNLVSGHFFCSNCGEKILE